MRNSKIVGTVVSLLLVMLLIVGCERFKLAEVKKEKVGDSEIAYYVRGQGEPLVMVMGFRGTMAIWDPALLEQLEKRFTLILFDNRGVGLSTDGGKEPLTIEAMAEDTVGLIKQLGYEKIHLLGWSMGSEIAMEVAFKHPEVLNTLILCSPNPGGPHQAKRTSDAIKKLTAAKLSRDEALSLLFPDTERGNRAANAYVSRLTSAVVIKSVPDDFKISPEVVERQVQALKLWSEKSTAFEQLPSIKVPTLVAGGSSDVLDESENVHIVASQIPFAWTAYFAGAGHNFLSQDHHYLSQLVTLFIESNKTAEKK